MVGSLFVTGGSGYLGSRFVDSIEPGAFQRVVCLFRGQPLASLPLGIETVKGDLLSPDSYHAALQGCDTVLHMAALTGKHPKANYFRVNADATRALVEAARAAGVRRFLFVSTIAVKFSGQARYHYAASKALAEQYVKRSGLDFCIVRPTMIFGRRAPVLQSLRRLATAPAVAVFGHGRTPVQPVAVDDVVAALLSVLNRPDFGGQNLEVGGPDVVSMEDLLRRIRSAAGLRPGPVVHVPVNLLLPIFDLLEKMVLPLLPFTAGQLGSFTSAGTAEPPAPGAFVAGQTLDQMLAAQ